MKTFGHAEIAGGGSFPLTDDQFSEFMGYNVQAYNNYGRYFCNENASRLTEGNSDRLNIASSDGNSSQFSLARHFILEEGRNAVIELLRFSLLVHTRLMIRDIVALEVDDLATSSYRRDHSPRRNIRFLSNCETVRSNSMPAELESDLSLFRAEFPAARHVALSTRREAVVSAHALATWAHFMATDFAKWLGCGHEPAKSAAPVKPN